MATKFIEASKGKIVSNSEAAAEFERIKESQLLSEVATAYGVSPEKIKKEAEAAGVNVVDLIKDKYPTVLEEKKKPAERKPGDIVSPEVKEPAAEREARVSDISKRVKAGTYELDAAKIAESFPESSPWAPSNLSAIESKPTKRDRAAEAARKETVEPAATPKVDATKSEVRRVQYAGGKELPLSEQFRDINNKVVPLDDPRVKQFASKAGINLGQMPGEAAAPKPVEVAPTVRDAVKASAQKKKEEAAPLVEEKPAETVQEKVSKTKQSSIRKVIAPESQFAIITAENPRFAAAEGGNEALKKELEAKGYVVEQIKGMYDSLENPFLVKNASPEDIQALGKKYGQESVILADKNNYKMSYTAGPNEGKYHSANKINVFDKAPDNYYSTVIRDGKPVYFSIPFDMEKLEGGPAKAAVPAEEAKPAAAAVEGQKPKSSEVPPQKSGVPAPLKILQEDFGKQAGTAGLINDTTKVLEAAGTAKESAVQEATALVRQVENISSATGESSSGVLKNALSTGLEVLKKNPKTSLAAAAFTGLGAMYAASQKKEGPPSTPPSPPTPPPSPAPPAPKPPGPKDKKRAENTLETGDKTLSEFEKYKQRMSLTPEEEKRFAETENKLKESLITAREAYSQGMRSTELYKALEKIAEGLVLFGSGLYGMKTGIDAVSGLKFSPIDWSTRTDRLTKELDLAEKQYVRDMESTEKEKRGIEKLREEAVRFDESRKEREERRAERAETKKTAAEAKTVKEQKDILEGQIKDLDRQINDIEKVRTATPKSKDAMQRQYQALATTLGIPEKEFMTGLLGGFREEDADAAFLKKQTELTQKRARLEKQLRGESVPAPSIQPAGLTPEQEARRQELLRKQGGK